MKQALFIVFLTFDFLFLNLDRIAAADLSLSISPPVIEIQADPPEVIDTPITLRNQSEETAMLNIQLKPFKAGNEENGEVLYLSGKDPLIFKNIKIIEDNKTIEKVVISPNQTKNLNLHIDITKDETLSDYYFSVIFVSENTHEERLNYLKIQGGIALNVLLSIKGNPPLIDAKPTSIGKIVEFSTPSILENGPVPFTIRLKNQSNHFIAPHGNITIKNIFGKTIGKVKLSPINILANTSRLHKSEWKDNILLGYYTAILTINMSDKEPAIVKSVSFFVFPFRAFIILLITVSGIIFVKSGFNRHRNR